MIKANGLALWPLNFVVFIYILYQPRQGPVEGLFGIYFSLYGSIMIIFDAIIALKSPLLKIDF